ncbi:MAG: DUF1573 domain-containing protein [Bacteroidota bacterium]
MKKFSMFSVSLMASVLLMSFTPSPLLVNSKMEKVSPLAAKATWAKEAHDFGEIKLKVPVSVEFTFTNTGDAPLIIKEVVTSCGCTASDYAKEPIMPGKSSTIKVSYNAANPGAFTKTITVKSNDVTESKMLTIKGVVQQS